MSGFVGMQGEGDGDGVLSECERGTLSEGAVSVAGEQKGREGDNVFVFGEDGVYELVYDDQYVEQIDETVTKLQLNRLSNLPMLDLSFFE